MLFSSVASVFALAAAGVHAHGYVSFIKADGKKYPGGVPGEKNVKSPIRFISTINPNKNPNGAAITCGANAKNAGMTAPVTAGTGIDLTWVAHPNQAWPHEMGPIITYMAKVPEGKTAQTVDPATLSFFKIQQHGQKSKGSNKWVVEDQMKLNTIYTVNVPEAIEDGEYIMRHELIALHLADKKGGAEFYSSCFNLKVSGGTGTNPSATAKFPGTYSASDKGIFTPGVFNRGFVYSFPGPAIPEFNSSGGNSTTPTETETVSDEPTGTVSSAVPESTESDECNDDEEPTTTGSAAAPAPTDDDCTDEEPESSSAPTSTKSKRSMPTGDVHNGYKRAGAWSKRMEKRYMGRPASS
ncbi:glycoside hydrolase family 61 protein [Ceratobasidium sp. AG-Ba]|nr:glycoside hydrolase family 61 protein [Ceratobasidium sp. AG-Ba]